MPTTPCLSCQMPVRFSRIVDGAAAICPGCGKRMVLRKKETPDSTVKRPRPRRGVLRDFLVAQAKGCLLLIAIILLLILGGILWYYFGPRIIVLR